MLVYKKVYKNSKAYSSDFCNQLVGAIQNSDSVIARRRFSVEAIPHFSEEIASQRALAMTYLELLLLVGTI
jgi:hypothetical protein